MGFDEGGFNRNEASHRTNPNLVVHGGSPDSSRDMRRKRSRFFVSKFDVDVT